MAIVDSSVIIHLSRIGKLALLKDFFGNIKITDDVFSELLGHEQEYVGKAEIRAAIGKWIKVVGLKRKNGISSLLESADIDGADASLILLAEQEKGILVTNDYLLVKVAATRNVECMWLTTFLLRAIEKKVISKKEGLQMLFDLVQAGMRLSIEVYAAIEKRIEQL